MNIVPKEYVALVQRLELDFYSNQTRRYSPLNPPRLQRARLVVEDFFEDWLLKLILREEEKVCSTVATMFRGVEESTLQFSHADLGFMRTLEMITSSTPL